MSVTRPYFRTCRPFLDGKYFYSGRWRYLIHPSFSQSPGNYVRAFQLIQKDLQELFDYVEPADKNLSTFSYRIHALLMRSCVEIEANSKAILMENGYQKSDDLNMSDYRKLNTTHHLSSYQVFIPTWIGAKSLRFPFSAWGNNASLSWYQAYNASKHDRRNEFENATFDNLLDAVCGLLVLLSAQFGTEDYSQGPSNIIAEGPNNGFEYAIGGLFHVKFPEDWPIDERYEFNWDNLCNVAEPFQKLDFTKTA